jgi:uncharacterized protein YlzI (FlbEa/FlbD family)
MKTDDSVVICKNCIYLNRTFWECEVLLKDPIITINYVTGKKHIKKYAYENCINKNMNGKCTDYIEGKKNIFQRIYDFFRSLSLFF